jgi:Concanavalin A-like lectin/glucanases superfamily
MSSSKDALEQARRTLRPPEDAYERFLERQHRNRRNSRIASGVVALVIAVSGLLVVVVAFSDRGERSEPASSCVPTPADITHRWPGDGSGVDTVGGRTATLHGDATFGHGLIGQAFVLDGAGDFVSVPHDPALDVGTGDFTVTLWVNFDDTDGEQVLVEKWVQRSFEPGGVIGWTLTKLPDNHIGFATVGDFSANSAPLNIPLRTWIHFAARRRGDAFQILMNGDLVASNTVSAGAFLDLDSPSSLKFGHRGGPDDTPGSISAHGYFLNGRIDEVKIIIGRALSTEELEAIVAAGVDGRRC